MYEDETEVLFVLSVIDSEIEYAKSQLQPQDTGHIHTAINWMQYRKKDLNKQLDSLRSSAG